LRNLITTPSAQQRRFRDILLRSRPPLLEEEGKIAHSAFGQQTRKPVGECRLEPCGAHCQKGPKSTGLRPWLRSVAAPRLKSGALRPTSLLMLLILLAAASCRQSMANEPRYRTYQESDFFPNGSSARPLPEGTVSQEQDLDQRFVNGTLNGQPAETLPFPVTL